MGRLQTPLQAAALSLPTSPATFTSISTPWYPVAAQVVPNRSTMLCCMLPTWPDPVLCRMTVQLMRQQATRWIRPSPCCWRTPRTRSWTHSRLSSRLLLAYIRPSSSSIVGTTCRQPPPRSRQQLQVSNILFTWWCWLDKPASSQEWCIGFEIYHCCSVVGGVA